jgi:uncharacterized BrkB/YihY/UPF0761 family membrane protein
VERRFGTEVQHGSGRGFPALLSSRSPFLKGNAMSNKAHLRPHKRQQQGSRNRTVAALLMVLLFLALLALSVVMVSSGHVIPPGVR